MIGTYELHNKDKQSKHNFTWQERKVMRALWLKSAPMTYEQILGVCVSALWREEHGQGWINMLMKKGVIVQLNSGEYDAVLDSYHYERYLKKRKLYTFFYPDPPYLPVSAVRTDLDMDDDPEHTYRICSKILEKHLKEREAQNCVSP